MHSLDALLQLPIGWRPDAPASVEDHAMGYEAALPFLTSHLPAATPAPWPWMARDSLQTGEASSDRQTSNGPMEAVRRDAYIDSIDSVIQPLQARKDTPPMDASRTGNRRISDATTSRVRPG